MSHTRKKQLAEVKALSGLTLNQDPKLSHKRKRSKTRPENLGYNPKLDSSRNPTSAKQRALRQRFDTKKMIVKDGKLVPKKTALLLRETPLKAVLDTNVIKTFHKKLVTSIHNYSPIAKIKFSDKGTPQVVITKKGNQLSARGTNGLFHFFSNQSPIAPTPALKIDEKGLNTTPAKKILKSTKLCKRLKIKITPELLQIVAKLITKNKGKRVVSQNYLLGGSATKYSHALGISIKNKSEWGHLIAHRFLSDLSQHNENLVSMTKESNTAMMTVEDVVKLLTEQYPEGIELDVTAHLLKGTQITDKVEYTITIGAFVFPFVFHGQLLQKPDLSNTVSIRLFFETLKELKKLEAKPTPPKVQTAPLAKASPAPVLTFSKTANTKTAVQPSKETQTLFAKQGNKRRRLSYSQKPSIASSHPKPGKS